MKGPYDFYTLVTCLLILALQIHNPFQSRDRSPCNCDGASVAARPTQAGVREADSRPSGPGEPARAEPIYRRPREASAAGSSPGLSTDALLRELDTLQGKAKEQQDTLAAAGRMPPPSPLLQQLKESEAAGDLQWGSSGNSGAQPPPMAQSPPRAMGQAMPSLQPAGDMPVVRRRDELGRFLQVHQSRGLGVVLGVSRGDFALRLLSDWSSAQGLYLVDPFIHIWRGYDDPANVQDADHQMIFEDLRNRLQPFEGRHVLVRDFSHSFAEVFRSGGQTPGMATFIYVDANHAEYAVSRDLELWWPLLAPGGILAGSTYADDSSGRVRVRSSVDKFAARRQLQVHLTQDDQLPSWLIIKQ